MRNNCKYLILNDKFKRQRGQALIVALLILIAGFGTLIFYAADPLRLQHAADEKTAAALAQARQGLIGWALMEGTGAPGQYGSLPCPDERDPDHPFAGSKGTFIGIQCTSYIGRLPFRALGLPDLRDGSGERLWYVLSPAYRDHPAVQPLNSNTSGQLTLTGEGSVAGVIAIVFAPGAALAGQDRSPGAARVNMANYLERDNANGDMTYVANATDVAGITGPAFNDQLIAVTADALWTPILPRVATEAKRILLAYFTDHNRFPLAIAYGTACTAANQGRLQPNPDCSSQPWPAAPALWFSDNQWHEALFYAVAPACTTYGASPCDGGGGFLTVDGTSSYRAIIITPGPARVGQPRPCNTVSDCLENYSGNENIDGNSVFVTPPKDASTNDRLTIVSP